MIYAIERWSEQGEMAFDNAFSNIAIQGKIYDLVKAPKDSGLERISEFILDDNNVFIKSNPRTLTEASQGFESATGIKPQELLLG